MEDQALYNLRYLKKILNIFGGHLICMEIPPRDILATTKGWGHKG
jgi:hypothetical protein